MQSGPGVSQATKTRTKWSDMSNRAFARQKLAILFDEYCNSTMLHCFKYIVRNRSVFHTFIWSILIVGEITLCLFLIYKQWTLFIESSTSINLSDNRYAVTNVAFPAVTVCNYNKLYEPKVMELVDTLMGKGYEKEYLIEYFRSLLHLYDLNPVSKYYEDVRRSLKDIGYDNVSEIMQQLSQPCDKLIESCKFSDANCLHKIKMVKSSRGFCCSFNSHFGEIDKNILYVTDSERSSALQMIVNVESSTYFATTRLYYGADVVVDGIYDYPAFSTVKTSLPLDTEAEVSLVPEIVESQQDIYGMHVNLRHCLFNDEHYSEDLHGRVKYSYQNCLVDCYKRIVYRHCACVPFFYPERNQTIPVCDFEDINCMKDSYEIQRQRPISCECYPECNHQFFHISALNNPISPELANKFKQSIVSVNDPSFKTMDYENKTILLVHFHELTCYKYTRSTNMTWYSLLAAFGGIFGLCLGGSLLSLVEFTYYLSLIILRKECLVRTDVDAARDPPYVPSISFGTNYSKNRNEGTASSLYWPELTSRLKYNH